MAQYEVTLPITGVAYLTVEADSEEQAISNAIDQCEQDHIEEWSAVHHVVQGNVFCGTKAHASAEKLEG